MRSDDILDQIDSALHDYDVSDDAMRSRPEPEPFNFGGFIPTVQITDEAGEWQDLPGGATVEIQVITPPELAEFAQQWNDFIDRMTRQRVEQARRAQEALEAFARALSEPIKPAIEEAASAFETLQQAAQREPERAPGRRRDRLAWQSPYGPPQRRR